jgi:hypothetical protein
MTTTAETYNILLEKIAKKWFDVETLETRGMDDLDFYDVSVFCMKKALDEAFKAGMELVEPLKPYKLEDDMSPSTTLKMILKYQVK